MGDSVGTDRQTLLAEFDQEMAMTRRVIERVPEASFTWTPHDQLLSLGGLAVHLANLPHWGRQILEGDSYYLATDIAVDADAPPPTEVLPLFDRHVFEVRRLLVDRTDAALMTTWTLKRGAETVLMMPRLTALRRFLIHRVIHHRGQMTVYLRLQGVALPTLYGPTADERM